MEKGLVMDLGRMIGFGRMMQLAHECWSEMLIYDGESSDAALVVGPCEGFTVPCWCKDSACCDICAGTGWVTKGVFDALAPIGEGDNTDGQQKVR